MRRTIQSSISCLYFFFSFFIKEISYDSTPLTQKERCFKKHTKNLSFFERHSGAWSLTTLNPKGSKT